MKKYLLLLVVAFGFTIAHAQVVQKNKPIEVSLNDGSDNAVLVQKSNTELKSSSDNKEAVRPALRRLVKMKDSVFIYEGNSLLMRMPAKDWPLSPLANKIPDESNLNDESPAANARSKGNVTAEKSNSQPDHTIAVKKNDSVYVFRNGALLIKMADNTKTLNQNKRAASVTNITPIPEAQELQ